jgi:thiol-disulfide isomerase/thioredoxin
MSARQWWACPRCHRVVPKLTELAEVLANGEISHVVCDQCIKDLRNENPVIVLDHVRDLGVAS